MAVGVRWEEEPERDEGSGRGGIESDDHLVAASPTKKRLRVRTKASSSSPRPKKKKASSSQLQESGATKKKKPVLVSRVEEGGREGRAGPPVPLRGDGHRVEGTVPAVELGEGLFQNGRESRLIALTDETQLDQFHRQLLHALVW